MCKQYIIATIEALNLKNENHCQIDSNDFITSSVDFKEKQHRSDSEDLKLNSCQSNTSS